MNSFFYAMIRFGPSIGWKAMLWKSTSFDIFCEIPFENAAICSCMYMRNVSDDQRPIFLMVLSLIPFKCIAMAPPARKL